MNERTLSFGLMSTNALKLTAMNRLGVWLRNKTESHWTVGVETHVSTALIAQPVGLSQTAEFAMQRARLAQRCWPDRIAVGIESGVVHTILHGDPGGSYVVTFDVAAVCMIEQGGTPVFGLSSGTVFPETYVEDARRIGFTHVTVGDVMARDLHCAQDDPHHHLTGGLVNRVDQMFTGIVQAAAQLREVRACLKEREAAHKPTGDLSAPGCL